MNRLDAKLAALDRVFRIYDQFLSSRRIACKKGCSPCCTCNVTLTTLEGYRILERLSIPGTVDPVERISRWKGRNRFQPTVTFNMLADLCAQGADTPEAESEPPPGACPLLDRNVCPVYPVRPFGCRCMVSETVCVASGAAEMDEFLYSVNTVFVQVIEHLDVDGFTGNLIDVLALLASDTRRRDYASGAPGPPAGGLISNRPLKRLFIPPEHRSRIEPILSALRKVRL